MALNDLCDAAVDRVQRPDRPLPAGKIRPLQAQLGTALPFGLGFALLLALPRGAAAALAGAVLAGLIILYDLYHKGNPWSVLPMAGCRFMVYVVAALGVAGRVNKGVLIAGLIQFSYIVLVSITARCENRRENGFPFPLIPLMLAGICVIDGICLSVLLKSPLWLIAGGSGLLLTHLGQKQVRGD